VVAVFLPHHGLEPHVRAAAPCGDDTGLARTPESRRPLRCRAGADGSTARGQGLHAAYDYTLRRMQGIAYAKWRDYDPGDTVRFYALRLHEISLIKSTTQRIIGQGTDWRLLNELKKELRG
jgi:hypothetical protein